MSKHSRQYMVSLRTQFRLPFFLLLSMFLSLSALASEFPDQSSSESENTNNSVTTPSTLQLHVISGEAFLYQELRVIVIVDPGDSDFHVGDQVELAQVLTANKLIRDKNGKEATYREICVDDTVTILEPGDSEFPSGEQVLLAQVLEANKSIRDTGGREATYRYEEVCSRDKVTIVDPGDSEFIEGEAVTLSNLLEINAGIRNAGGKEVTYKEFCFCERKLLLCTPETGVETCLAGNAVKITTDTPEEIQTFMEESNEILQELDSSDDGGDGSPALNFQLPPPLPASPS